MKADTNKEERVHGKHGRHEKELFSLSCFFVPSVDKKIRIVTIQVFPLTRRSEWNRSRAETQRMTENESGRW
ncbi:MAG: hypothetical protein [Olavius algarvensis Gamma 1 endosymbiont]|nr:MAG: hypothetical protein [Olavius algarvensis Gamma 1 endosymbiont]